VETYAGTKRTNYLSAENIYHKRAPKEVRAARLTVGAMTREENT